MADRDHPLSGSQSTRSIADAEAAERKASQYTVDSRFRQEQELTGLRSWIASFQTDSRPRA